MNVILFKINNNNVEKTVYEWMEEWKNKQINMGFENIIFQYLPIFIIYHFITYK